MEPLLISIAFYIIVISLCELSRQVVTQYTAEGSLGRRFFVELFGTLQVCTCVYENGLITKHYGLMGFFLTVFVLLLIHGTINRGAFVNPANNVENFWYGRIPSSIFITCLLGEVVGGYLAFRLARRLWWIGMSFDHVTQYTHFPCRLNHKVNYLFVCLYEIICCFIIRYSIGSVAPQRKKYAAAFSIAFFLSLAIYLIGVPGLNPVIASSRLMNCDGLDTSWFILTYWCCPLVGHILAATVEQRQLKLKLS